MSKHITFSLPIQPATERKVGKRANYNIYDVNLFDVPETEIKDVLPKTVVFEGKVIAEN